jgi:hypothetical protein
MALLPSMFRPEAPLRQRDVVGADGELGWTVGLQRGADLPPLRLSIRLQQDARMALRIDSCGEPAIARARDESRGGI